MSPKIGIRTHIERFASAEELTQLRAAGRLLIETHRYSNTYAIDRHHIDRITAAGQVPIVHLGNIADIRRLVQPAPWLVVLLWIPLQVCEQRSRQRGDSDTVNRLQAWDETLADLHANDNDLFHRRFHTHQATPQEIAEQTADAFFNQRASTS
ncbi:hypothetical protein [Nonomuraea longicatena]|uniref:Guanylate kinase n=1 Tax=Nonomuraea longicatena TaxID=83682 RepID=A0ABN1QD00_9ACTN